MTVVAFLLVIFLYFQTYTVMLDHYLVIFIKNTCVEMHFYAVLVFVCLVGFFM